MDTKQPEALRIADDLHHSITHYGAEDAFTFSAYEAEQCVRALHAENESLRAGYDAARLEIESLQKAATDRHALQATGAHPAPCARYCEAVAFNIERRNLHAENERLRTCNKDAQHEIANLQERVQELGQMARDVNSRRVQELEAQLAAVGAGGVEPLRKRECLHKISEPAQPVAWAIFAENGKGLMWTQSRQNAEVSAKNVGLQVTPLYAAPQPAVPAQAGENEFVSRAGWVESAMRAYLIAGDTEKEARECAEHLWSEADMDDLPDPIRAAMEDCEGRGAVRAAPVDAAKDAPARFKAQHEFLVWNREQTPPPIEPATEYSVFNQAVDFYIAARAAQGGANG